MSPSLRSSAISGSDCVGVLSSGEGSASLTGVTLPAKQAGRCLSSYQIADDARRCSRLANLRLAGGIAIACELLCQRQLRWAFNIGLAVRGTQMQNVLRTLDKHQSVMQVAFGQMAEQALNFASSR